MEPCILDCSGPCGTTGRIRETDKVWATRDAACVEEEVGRTWETLVWWLWQHFAAISAAIMC